MKEVRKFERAANPSAVSGTFSSLVDEAPHSTKEVHDIPCREEEEEEEEVKERLDYRPCHYFDYIAGTSTGGLIAIMLGRLRMDVDLALENYKDLCCNIFGKTSLVFGGTLKILREGWQWIENSKVCLVPNQAQTKRTADSSQMRSGVGPSFAPSRAVQESIRKHHISFARTVFLADHLFPSKETLTISILLRSGRSLVRLLPLRLILSQSNSLIQSTLMHHCQPTIPVWRWLCSAYSKKRKTSTTAEVGEASLNVKIIGLMGQ